MSRMSRKKLVSLMLSVLLLIAAVVPAFSVQAADSATVTVVFSDGETIRPFFDLTVEDGAAEAYGLASAAADHAGQPVETVTALDAVVQAHAALYGDAFTAATAANYLTVSYGFASKAFGESANYGFAVQDATPHDDMLITSEWGSYYTGYALDTARIQTGDVVVLYKYTDAVSWSDLYPLFSEASYTAVEGRPFSVRVNGYGIMMNGCCEQSVIDANTIPLAGAELYVTKDFDGALTSAGTLNADGSASVTVDEEGVWYLVVKGSVNGSPVIPLIRKITVSANPTRDAKLNVPSAKPVDYKSNVHVTVSASGLPEGCKVALYADDVRLIDGEESVSYYMERVTENQTFTAKVIDADGNVQSNALGELEQTFTVQVRTCFFARLKAFFLGLFGIVPTVEIRP